MSQNFPEPFLMEILPTRSTILRSTLWNINYNKNYWMRDSHTSAQLMNQQAKTNCIWYWLLIIDYIDLIEKRYRWQDIDNVIS